VRERHDHRAQPLARPVELDRRLLVPQHARDAVAAREATGREAARDPGRALAQGRVRQALLADERLRLRRPLGRGEQAEREVQGRSTTWTIASTIGS
jgi:hypothetical protein